MEATPDTDLERRTPIVAMIAGEESGDALGAELMVALRKHYPRARFVGIGGSRMTAAGFDAWHSISELSVMGVTEVLRHLPRLLQLRRQLGNQLLKLQPDVVIGIDAPDFNLGLERRMKRAGLRTVHYVSPSIWAWREQRAKRIGESADLVLCLFPMEAPIYARHAVDARFVGHPLADTFAENSDRNAAREALDLPPHVPVLAVLPGSRAAEINRLGETFLQAVDLVAADIAELRVIIPAANVACQQALQPLLPRRNAHVTLLEGHAHDALRAADVVLLASGTAALEAMLAHRAMVVGYRISALTYRIVHGFNMMKTHLYSLPNVLAGRALVPELMQDECQPQALATEVLALFSNDALRMQTEADCARLHTGLRGGPQAAAADRAASAIAELLESHNDAR